MKYIKPFVEHFKERPVFTIRDVKIFLETYKISRNYLYLLLHNLLSTGRIYRITKGVYSFRKDPTIAGFAFSPSYHGLQEALSLHNLWEQEANVVIITPKKVRSGVRRILGANVIIKRIDRKMFFGFQPMKYYDLWIPVSDIEKTLIDFLYFKEPLDREIAEEIKRKIRKEIMREYMRRIPKYLRKRVLGFFGEKYK